MRIFDELIIFMALVVFCVEATDPIRVLSSLNVDILLTYLAGLVGWSLNVPRGDLGSGILELSHDIVVDFTATQHIEHIGLVLAL